MENELEALPAGTQLLIEGLTLDGSQFRPNDWADRMACSLATFKNHRIDYSPLLYPQVVHGHKCLIVDAALQPLHPEIFEQVVSFAKKNQLRMKVKAVDAS